jgi:hypothetical protein
MRGNKKKTDYTKLTGHKGNKKNKIKMKEKGRRRNPNPKTNLQECV